MRILVADDSTVTRFVLRRILEGLGHEVVEALDGEEAWQCLIVADPPRIAVLDWMMPRLDGVALCQRLLSHERLPFIYRIVLTSRDQPQDLIFALEHGAHDYQRKPVDPAELKTRIDVGIRLVEANDRIANYASDMETLAEDRARQLVHSDRLASIGTLSAGIAHEINNPLTFISGNLQTLQVLWRDMKPCIEHCLAEGIGSEQRLRFMIDELPDLLGGIQEGVQRASRIVKGLRSYARRSDQPTDRASCDVNACLEDALVLCGSELKHHVSIEKNLQPDLAPLLADAQQLTQVFVNLITNSAHAMDSVEQAVLRIQTIGAYDHIDILIEDNGPGIPAALRKKIFDPFFTTKPVGKGTGLGLAISKDIVAAHGGNVSAENLPHGGACLRIKLPLAHE